MLGIWSADRNFLLGLSSLVPLFFWFPSDAYRVEFWGSIRVLVNLSRRIFLFIFFDAFLIVTYGFSRRIIVSADSLVFFILS